MNYTRKRALLACDFCRHRKRRCDGDRPCSTCRESNADCRYKDLPIERVESPSASNEAVVERLGRIEALLEEQSHRLQNLFLHEPSSSSFDGSHLSISPKVSIDASAAGVVDSSEGTDPSLFGSHSHPFSRSPFHLTPEFAASAIAGLGGITAPGAPTTSPPAPVHVPSPVGGNSLLGIDASNRPQYLYQQQPHRSQQQHFFNAFHGTSSSSNTAGSTAAPTPVFGYPTGTSAFPSGSGLTSTTTTTSNTINTATIGNTNTSRGLLSSGKAPSSVATSEVSSTQQNVEQDQQFLIPYEHSTSANTLLSHPLVRFFLEYQQRAKSNVLERRPSGGSGAGKGKGKAQFTTYHYHYPRTYFFDIENQHPLPPQLDLVFSPGVVPAILTQPVLAASHPTVLDGLVRNYFTYVHPSAPLFSASRFRQWSSKVYEQGPDDSIGTAICLVVWALGSLVAPSTQGGAPSRSSSCSSSPDPTVQRQSQNERDRFALSLFQPAMKIILRHTLWEFGPAALETSQALPGRQLIRHIEEHRRDGDEPEKDRQVLPVFWVSFMWECDRSAELDVPRSGIEPLADNMPLPSSLDPDDGDDMICFVAEIAARRLLNRIHSTLYATGGIDSVQGGSLTIPDSDSATSGRTTPGNKRKRADYNLYASTTPSALPTATPGVGIGLGLGSSDNTGIDKMLPVSAELNRQLEAWYRAMPEHIRPLLSDNNTSGPSGGDMSFIDDLNDLSGDDMPWLGGSRSKPQHAPTTTKPYNERIQILRIQYYAARHIIHRPFVLAVAYHQQQQILSRERATRSASTSDTATNTPPPVPPPPPLPTAVLEKCAICVDSCAAYLVHVLPLLERRSNYLWSFCQSSMACLLVLVVADACPSIAATRPLVAGQRLAPTMDITHLRDQVASRLRIWAVPGSSFEAELRIIESLPIGPS